MFYRRIKDDKRIKDDTSTQEEKNVSEYELLTKCLARQKDILRTLELINDNIKNLIQGEVKSLKDELREDKKFSQALIMKMLEAEKEKANKVSPSVAAYLATKSGNTSTASVKELQKHNPKLP